MKHVRKGRIVCVAAVLTLVLSSCGGAEPGDSGVKPPEASRGEAPQEGGSRLTEGETEQRSQGEESETRPNPTEETTVQGAEVYQQGEGFKIKAAENLGWDNTMFSQGFYKAGNIKQQVYFSPGEGGMDSGQLEYSFATQEENHPNYYSSHVGGELGTEPGRLSYDVTPEESQASLRLTFGREGSGVLRVSVEGDEELTGDYYPAEDCFTYPDVFQRYLSRADLCLWPSEDLRLLRNEVYAAHGRIFNDEVLNQYFSGKVWYRPVRKPEEFSENLLSDVERKNIAFIREMEEDTDRNVLDGQNSYDLESLPPAPYLPWLGQYGETTLEADLTQAEDKGAYYVVQGSISVPAQLTQEDFEEVSQGGRAKVITDELTGEYLLLELNPKADENPIYGYLLYKEGDVSQGRGNETGITLNYEKGVYHLWQTSMDTVMKRVYQGDIYILKGAVSGGDVSPAGASKNQKEIVPPMAAGAGEGQTMDSVSGNQLCYNMRGYFTGIYFIGD